MLFRSHDRLKQHTLLSHSEKIQAFQVSLLFPLYSEFLLIFKSFYCCRNFYNRNINTLFSRKFYNGGTKSMTTTMEANLSLETNERPYLARPTASYEGLSIKERSQLNRKLRYASRTYRAK